MIFRHRRIQQQNERRVHREKRCPERSKFFSSSNRFRRRRPRQTTYEIDRRFVFSRDSNSRNRRNFRRKRSSQHQTDKHLQQRKNFSSFFSTFSSFGFRFRKKTKKYHLEMNFLTMEQKFIFKLNFTRKTIIKRQRKCSDCSLTSSMSTDEFQCFFYSCFKVV